MNPPSARPGVLAGIGPDISAIQTEDDAPVDNIISEKQMRLLTEPLYTSWPGPPGDDGAPLPFVAFANVGVFTTASEPAVVPDVFLSVEVTLHEDFHRKEHRTYFVWEFGKVPDVVIEVVSNREGGELGAKKNRYARMRVPSYVVWDPEEILSTERLQVFELRGVRYQRVSEARFADLGLGLTVWEGRFENATYHWLRWCDVTGAVIPTGAERAAAMEARADEARARADEATVRADEAKVRAERMAAKLRALGIDPDAP